MTRARTRRRRRRSATASLANPLVLAAASPRARAARAPRTRWGLRLRAAGDRPEALVAVGVSPRRVRLFAASSAARSPVRVARSFARGRRVLRGHVERPRLHRARDGDPRRLAPRIRARWRASASPSPTRSRSSSSSRTHVFGHRIPSELAPLLPYVLALVVLPIYGGSSRPPRRSASCYTRGVNKTVFGDALAIPNDVTACRPNRARTRLDPRGPRPQVRADPRRGRHRSRGVVVRDSDPRVGDSRCSSSTTPMDRPAARCRDDAHHLDRRGHAARLGRHDRRSPSPSHLRVVPPGMPENPRIVPVASQGTTSARASC